MEELPTEVILTVRASEQAVEGSLGEGEEDAPLAVADADGGGKE